MAKVLGRIVSLSNAVQEDFKPAKMTNDELLTLLQFMTASLNYKSAGSPEKAGELSNWKGSGGETTTAEASTILKQFIDNKKKPVSENFKVTPINSGGSDASRRNLVPSYQSFIDTKSFGSKIVEMNNHLKMQCLVKLKDSQIVSPEMYYLGPLLHAYGTSLNTKMIPPETGIYLEHFSNGALGLLHIINKLGQFMGWSHLKALEKNLPTKSQKVITLLFDLDETLAHCKITRHADPDLSEEVEILIRPYARSVLEELRCDFELGLFTSAAQSYAEQVLQQLDPLGELFSFKLFKDSCLDIGDNISIKDLRVLKGRDPASVFLIDNNLYCYGLQLTQGIPITPFTGGMSDVELLKLRGYLKVLGQCKDPASYNTRYFGHDILLHQIKNSLQNLPNLMLERILEVAIGMKKDQ